MPAQHQIKLLVILALTTGMPASSAAVPLLGLSTGQLSSAEKQLPDIKPDQLFDQALQLASSVEDADRKNHILLEIALKLAEAGRIEQAFQVVSSINFILDTWRNESLSDMAMKLAEAGYSEPALQVLTRTIQVSRNETSAEVLIEIAETAVKLDKTDLALQVLTQAAKIATTSEGDDYSKTYRDRLAIDLAKLNQFEQALQIAQTIRSPDEKVKAWSGIAVAMALSGQVERARELLSNALNLAQTLSDGFSSNGSCYNERGAAMRAVVISLAQIDRIQEALQLASDVANCTNVYGTRLTSNQGDAYAAIIDHPSSIQELRAILPKFQALEDELDRNQALAEFAIRFAELGEVDQAVQIALELNSVPTGEAEWSPYETLVTVASKLAEQGAFEQAIQISNRMPNSQAQVLINIGSALERAGQSERAADFFTQAFQLAQVWGSSTRVAENQRAEFDSSSRYDVAIALAGAGQVGLAIQLVQGLSVNPESSFQRYESSVQRRDLAVKLAEAGQFETALQLAETIPLPDAKAEALASLAAVMSQGASLHH